MTETQWFVSRPLDLQWRDWDGLGAVYDDGTGDTHLIDALAVELLSLLAQQPRSVRQLVDDLADALPDDMGHEIAAAFFERQLLALQNLALIEPMSSPE